MSNDETALHRRLGIAAVIAVLVLAAALTTPAGAQTDEVPEDDSSDEAPSNADEVSADEAALIAQQSELQSRLDALQNEFEELNTAEPQLQSQIAALDSEDAEIAAILRQNQAGLETAADALELLALERREPAIVRGVFAIERFVSGDPSRQALSQELQAIGGTDTAEDPLQQQEVFASIIEGAVEDLERIDGEIEARTFTVVGLQSIKNDRETRRAEVEAERETLSEQLSTTSARLDELGETVPMVEEELDDITAELEFVQSLGNLAAAAEGADPEDLSDLGPLAVLTGRPAEGSPTRAALAVKIDNVPNARPQAGINSADVVYVELVEGGQTRFAAVFQSENAGTIGPVRSMRTTDINLLRPLNSPLFASSGANDGVTSAVNASSLINVSASTGAGSAYFRDSSGGRFAPHNLFSSDSALRSTSSSAGTPPQLFSLRRPGSENPNNPEPTNGVNVSYQNTSVSYVWDGEGWARSQDGGATIDATTGARTAPETVIVRFTPYGTSPADRNSPEATTVGSGTAWIFTEGQLIRGNWSKASGDAVTIYTDGDGNVVELAPGRVWVELPPPGGASLR